MSSNKKVTLIPCLLFLQTIIHRSCTNDMPGEIKNKRLVRDSNIIPRGAFKPIIVETSLQTIETRFSVEGVTLIAKLPDVFLADSICFLTVLSIYFFIAIPKHLRLGNFIFKKRLI